MRYALITPIGLVLLASASWVAAKPPPLVVKQPQIPPSKRAVSFDEARAARVELELLDFAAGKLDLHQKDATLADRRKGGCKLDVVASKTVLDETLANSSEACRAILEPLLEGDGFDLAVSVPSSDPNAITAVSAEIVYEPPKAYVGPATAILVEGVGDGDVREDEKKDPKPRVPNWDTAKLPDHVSVVSDECFVKAGGWREVACDPATRAVRPDEETKAILSARWAGGQTDTLFVRVLDGDPPEPPAAAGAWRSFSFGLKPLPKKDPPDPQKPPRSSLEERCLATVSLTQSTHFYLACVDAYPSQRGIVTLSCERSRPGSCTRIGELVELRRGFVVAVFRPDGAFEEVALDGTAGNVSLVRSPKDGGLDFKGLERLEIDRRADLGVAPKQLWYFDPRSPGKVDLDVKIRKVKADESILEIASFKWSYQVQRSYRLALRLGLGVSWLPFARNVGIQTSVDMQRYAAVIEGSDGGLVQSELVFGLSVFLGDEVKEGSLAPKLALGARLSILQGGDGKWFRSLMVGPELAFGPDVSIGIFAGVSLHDFPEDGYEPGTLIPANVSSIPTQIGLTPTFGVVVNFTPGFLKEIGVAK